MKSVGDVVPLQMKSRIRFRKYVSLIGGEKAGEYTGNEVTTSNLNLIHKGWYKRIE